MIKIAKGMLYKNTPIDDYRKELGLKVKREDLSCPKPGPPFSKSRGVYARIFSRSEEIIGVLDTAHSQAGQAVARACSILNKVCYNFYPVYRSEGDPNGTHTIRPAQNKAAQLGAVLMPFPAGRSCILYHKAKKVTEEMLGYMMPNALKLSESVEETAREAKLIKEQFDTVIIPISSGTIAAGVVKGLSPQNNKPGPRFIIHMGYSRSHEEVNRYITESSGVSKPRLILVDENYAYKDIAREGVTPPWPCNPYYDLKAFRWFVNLSSVEKKELGNILFWNIG